MPSARLCQAEHAAVQRCVTATAEHLPEEQQQPGQTHELHSLPEYMLQCATATVQAQGYAKLV